MQSQGSWSRVKGWWAGPVPLWGQLSSAQTLAGQQGGLPEPLFRQGILEFRGSWG